MSRPANPFPSSSRPNPRAKKPKEIPKTRPKLSDELLLGDDGLGYVLRHFPRNFKYRVHGLEVDQFMYKVEQVSAYKRIKALISLKKGAQLVKYGRKGKPQLCHFRLSSDETTLIWISSSGGRSLKLASVSKLIPGHRTAVFQRHLRPEKDFFVIFSYIQQWKEICNDKVEPEVWISGLSAIISSGQGGRSKIDGWCDGGLYIDESRDLTSNSASDSSAISFNPVTSPKSFRPENPPNSDRSHGALDNASMQAK